jgi:hypothetical protein
VVQTHGVHSNAMMHVFDHGAVRSVAGVLPCHMRSRVGATFDRMYVRTHYVRSNAHNCPRRKVEAMYDRAG